MRRQVVLVHGVELHGYADHVVTLLVQQQSRHRRINAAAHGDDNFLSHARPLYLPFQPSIAGVGLQPSRRHFPWGNTVVYYRRKPNIPILLDLKEV